MEFFPGIFAWHDGALLRNGSVASPLTFYFFFFGRALQLYNDQDKGDLMRFWRQSPGEDEALGYEAATRCYLERLQRIEQEGGSTRTLWELSLKVLLSSLF